MPLLIALLLLILCAPVSADELFVRNRKFTGAVSGGGAEMWVDLEALCQALDWPLQNSGSFFIGTPPPGAEAGKVYVHGQVIAHKPGPRGQTMVSLKEFAAASQCKLSVNSSMKTVDLYLPPNTAATGMGEWGGATVFNEPAPPPEKATPQEVIARFFEAGRQLPRIDLEGTQKVTEYQTKQQLNAFYKAARPYLTREYSKRLDKSRKTPKGQSELEKALDEDPSLLEDPNFQMMIQALLCMYEAMRTGTPRFLGERSDDKNCYVSFAVVVTDPLDGQQKELTMIAWLQKEGGRWKIADSFKFQ